MTPTEAAQQIGCSVSTVKKLIRDGTMKANKLVIPSGYIYNITQSEVSRVASLPKTSLKGRPRGIKNNA